MDINEKIVNINNLNKSLQGQRAKSKKIVLCQGHFNSIHPGHLRFLEFARQQGDCLIVAIQGYNWLEDKNKGVFFGAEERARGVASLQKVDKVVIFNEESILDVIKAVKPDIYVRGEEFSKYLRVIQDEINLVKKLDGKVVFSSGQVEYSTSDFLDNDLFDLMEKSRHQFKKAIEKQKVSENKLAEYFDAFKKQKILVIGDAIVDQYVACDALGMSAEAPIINIRELESKDFVGGAAVIARHIKALGANCYFASVIGNDQPGKFIQKELTNDGITTKLIVDKERETTFKIRYMVGKQKILRVSRLKEHHINEKLENSLINYAKTLVNDLDGIIISDFAYGVITPGLISTISKLAKKHNIKLFGDSQSSSQVGDVGKFEDFDLITPTEREARLALNDKFSGLEQIGMILLENLQLKNLIVTLGENGLVAYQKLSDGDALLVKSQHFPALNVNPVDVMGAGDSLLSGLSLAMCAGGNLMEASIIASGVSSIAVSKVGNIPVKAEELKKWLIDLTDK
ncbi:MAG: hypothetical protein ACD_20C00350G0020 [uncultured bacterium]|nr:MAG: hypothetical protein ACD_20C00350G0020 [uncultured bacterium]HBH17729.1 ADP-heptose synthase [Cyanobacteria bacterium UBA9579]